ncbi:MAG: M28 family metallopeptidase [Bacteroidota bacterium]
MIITFISCGTSKRTSFTNELVKNTYGGEISPNDLKTNIYKLASDDFEGRRTGENGQKIAAKYIAEQYKKLGIKPPLGFENYFQKIPQEFLKKHSNSSSENVVAYIRGNEKPDELLIISAHYDHLGIKGKNIYNGADDNASGTSAVLAIAKAFQKAKIEGDGPKRSILFLHFTGEEEGLFGSKYYTVHPIFPLSNTVCNLNIDMVGRVDNEHKNKPEYVYLIGADKLSSELHKISEDVNNNYTKLKLDYIYNDDNDPNRFYYRSDHYNFAKNNIPIIFYFNGVHKDYHKPTDTADKINYTILTKRTQLIFYTAWEIANREQRLAVDN